MSHRYNGHMIDGDYSSLIEYQSWSTSNIGPRVVTPDGYVEVLDGILYLTLLEPRGASPD